jgi:alpha/beta superfamily hydrolase
VHDDGVGEQDDVRAALDQMQERFAGQPLVLGGFSFGSAMALRVAAKDDRVRAVVALGFPSSMSTALESFDARGRPLLFVQGERDTLGPAAALRETVTAMPEPRQIVIVPEADHFFTGQLDALHDAVSAWAGRRPWETA